MAIPPRPRCRFWNGNDRSAHNCRSAAPSSQSGRAKLILAQRDTKNPRDIPVQHRSAQAQLHLTEIRARAGLVSARTALVNAARGLVKSYGERLRKCGTQQFRRETASELSAELREALEPLLREVESLNERIQEYDRRIEKMAKEAYPETALLWALQRSEFKI